jgi:hypothetical protein
MYHYSLITMRFLADGLVFVATILYIAIIFGGLNIPSHIYHNIHTIFKVLLSIGLVTTSLFSCEEGKTPSEEKKHFALRCKVSSKFSLITGVLLLTSVLVNWSSLEIDSNMDGLLSYSDFSTYIDGLTGSSISEKLKSNMFDLLGGDKNDRISIQGLSSMFFPLA